MSFDRWCGLMVIGNLIIGLGALLMALAYKESLFAVWACINFAGAYLAEIAREHFSGS